MNIKGSAVKKFSKRLARVRNEASQKILDYLDKTEFMEMAEAGLLDDVQMAYFVDYCYGIVQKYGEATSALSAEMYDAIAKLSGKHLPPAVPAKPSSYAEARRAVYGVMKTSKNRNSMANAIGRQVKQAGADTMLRNAGRDGAQFAWIPQGDTCAFCMMLASNGWQYMSKKAMTNGHAEHIHANCDCEYVVRFDNESTVGGYDPEEYRAAFDQLGDTGNWDESVNAMRRYQYQQDGDKIRAQHRAAYAEQEELEEEAEEIVI